MKKKKYGRISVVLTITAIVGGVIWLGYMTETAKTIRNISSYEEYFGKQGKHRESGLVANQIFPESLPESAMVEKFAYRHEDLMDPSDAAILVYTCDEEDYEIEITRLKDLETNVEDAYGVYGITEFPYEVVAVEADQYYGVIYAMIEANDRRIIYVENTYCNYFSDINYTWYIGKEYLPKGYNAEPENPVRKAFNANTR